MEQFKAIAASWARSFIAASIAVYLAGVTDPKAIISAGAAAVLPVIMRYMNPKDSGFGIIEK